ncbi:c722865a-ba15-4d3a-a4c9-262fc74c50e5 [Sclerotinia trifoliorum]|uniref:C722865a-ba15-4d3a-a4c9-262fc74c50e5 n=1 Tax=Sclerotinia trifoliorum TaxID=28548 RepID=A0A8H2VZV5_9HELO|nr:c722865a-ba15-4d3a-a4c9-262fc74c50e5 [Sclerotinia trifoliorum]
MNLSVVDIYINMKFLPDMKRHSFKWYISMYFNISIIPGNSKKKKQNFPHEAVNIRVIHICQTED